MTQVFVKVHLDLIETIPDFFRKLKRYVGPFRIEGQDFDDQIRNVIKISFPTDKVEIKGDNRQVDLECRRNEKGSWYFTSINTYYE